MAERKGLVELVRGHPTVLVDDGVPGKHQDPAEPGQRHPGERQEQRKQAGRRSVFGRDIRPLIRLLIWLLGGRC